jgi:hypothetical protein
LLEKTGVVLYGIFWGNEANAIVDWDWQVTQQSGIPDGFVFNFTTKHLFISALPVSIPFNVSTIQNATVNSTITAIAGEHMHENARFANI